MITTDPDKYTKSDRNAATIFMLLERQERQIKYFHLLLYSVCLALSSR